MVLGDDCQYSRGLCFSQGGASHVKKGVVCKKQKHRNMEVGGCRTEDLDFLIGKFGEKGVAEAFIKAQQVRGEELASWIGRAIKGKVLFDLWPKTCVMWFLRHCSTPFREGLLLNYRCGSVTSLVCWRPTCVVLASSNARNTLYANQRRLGCPLHLDAPESRRSTSMNQPSFDGFRW